MDQAAKGKKALEEKDYEAAIALFSAAIESVPTSPDYLIQRSTAYLRSQQPEKALHDADRAVLSAKKRAKRELIIEAQFRRGCALHNLERYADARYIFGLVNAMDPKHKMSPSYFQRAEKSLKALPEGDAKGVRTVEETPEVDPTAGSAIPASPVTAPAASSKPAAPSSNPVVQTPADKIRHEWYQSSENVYFTLLVKGAPADKTAVEVQARSLSISFPLIGSASSFDFTLDPLFAAVVPERSTTRMMPTKVEVVLVKAVPGQKWAALESKEPVVATKEEVAEGGEALRPAVAVNLDRPTTAPAYPTSSKSGPKDWDKVTREQLRDSSKAGSGAKGDGDDDDDDDYEGGDEANAFFKKLFKGASPDVRRAMMKSYTESNGTALSTNWDEVSKGKVETLPPDGMEAREWNK